MFKKTFENRSDYIAFAKQVGQCSAKLSMGEYSFLRPYKQRVKARFLNQGKIVDWAATILDKWDSLDQQAQDKLGQLPRHRTIVELLGQTLALSNEVAKLLKDKGLNSETLQQARQFIVKRTNGLSTNHPTVIFAKYLQKYLDKYEGTLNAMEHKGQTVHVCSDVIERLFGRFKAKVGDNYFVTASTISLELPLMCLPKEELKTQIQTALEAIFMSNLADWKSEQNTDNQSDKRAKFFKK